MNPLLTLRTRVRRRLERFYASGTEPERVVDLNLALSLPELEALLACLATMPLLRTERGREGAEGGSPGVAPPQTQPAAPAAREEEA